MKALEISNLSFSYDGNKDVISNLSLSIEEGEYVSIVGHNGSGKSTLSMLIIGLLEAESGEIKVFDKPLNLDNVNEIRRQTGIVFQNPDNQFVGSTVEDDIAFGLENRQIPYEEMHMLVNTFATRVGMIDYLKSEPSSLSGGQKQRVALAGVLALKPKLLILDEATSMLDPKGKREILELVREVKEQNGLTVISITHDIEEAYLADRVVVLDHGQVALNGTPDEVFSNESVIKSLKLEQPFIYKLRKEFSKYGVEFTSERSVDEVVSKLCQSK